MVPARSIVWHTTFIFEAAHHGWWSSIPKILYFFLAGGLMLVPPHPVYNVEDQRAPVQYIASLQHPAPAMENGAHTFFFGCGNIQYSIGMCPGHPGHWELGPPTVQASG